jgi:hypothetical protein
VGQLCALVSSLHACRSSGQHDESSIDASCSSTSPSFSILTVCHRSILQAPFTPFIVIFCYAISNSSQSDLAILSDFVTSLESCRTVSEGADKLYKMCHIFLQVAKLYMEAKTKEASTPSGPPSTAHMQSDGTFYVPSDGKGLDINSVNEFDPYLSALGLVPNAAWPSVTTFAPAQDNLETFVQGQMDSSAMNHNSVQDWFSGSRYIMNLMEEDITMPDLGL